MQKLHSLIENMYIYKYIWVANCRFWWILIYIFRGDIISQEPIEKYKKTKSLKSYLWQAGRRQGWSWRDGWSSSCRRKKTKIKEQKTKYKNTKIQYYKKTLKKSAWNHTCDKQAEGEAGVEEMGGVAHVGHGDRSHCKPQVHPWLHWEK